jgi:hypothetical protein
MLRTVVDAVASAIAGIDSLPAYSVAVGHMHEWHAQKLRTIKVAVSPRGADTDNVGRGVIGVDYRIGIVVGKHCETEAEADAVFLVSEGILDAIRGTLTFDLPEAVGRVALTSATMDLATEESLNEQNIYRASIEATYRLLKG